LDGKPATIVENDLQRRNAITMLLEEWGLLTIIKDEKEKIVGNLAPLHQIKIISHKEKNEWDLQSKYTIGKKKIEY
jgi:hypothetical protein